MAEKIFLADKETLDAVNEQSKTTGRNVGDIHSRVGTTTDNNGTATGGTLMGKINALISGLSNITSWIATNLNIPVSSLQSKVDAYDQYLDLKAKASRYKSTKIAIVTTNAGQETTIINIIGPGEIRAISVNSTATVALYLDGVYYGQQVSSNNIHGLGDGFLNGKFFTEYTGNTAYSKVEGGVCFSKSCKLVVFTSSSATARVLYDVYE